MTTLFAEVERDLISERTREGLAKAKTSGTMLGRPNGSLVVSRLDGEEDEIRQFIDLGVSRTAIAEITGVSLSTFYNFMATRAGTETRSLACISTRIWFFPQHGRMMPELGNPAVLLP